MSDGQRGQVWVARITCDGGCEDEAVYMLPQIDGRVFFACHDHAHGWMAGPEVQVAYEACRYLKRLTPEQEGHVTDRQAGA